jgi:hypothetical protein
MGATAHLKSISANLIGLMRADPSLIEPFVCALPPSLPPGLPAALREQILKSLDDEESRLEFAEDIRCTCPAHADEILAEAAVPDLNLDKAWSELAPCITGANPPGSPLARCIVGGTEFGPDLGYGPAEFLTPEEVAESSLALESLGIDEFRQHARSMQLPADCIDQLEVLLVEVRSYYREAAKNGLGMLLRLA